MFARAIAFLVGIFLVPRLSLAIVDVHLCQLAGTEGDAFAAFIGTPSSPNDPVAKEIQEKIPGVQAIFLLGGQQGGRSYRVVLADGLERLVKRYHRRNEMWDDLHRLELSQAALARIPEDRRPFRIVSGEPLEPHLRFSPYAVFTYVRGRNLQSVLEDPAIALELRDHLRQEFARAWDDFRESIHALDWRVDWQNLRVPSIWLQHLQTGAELQIYLKPENIIVEAGTLRLWINDPY